MGSAPSRHNAPPERPSPPGKPALIAATAKTEPDVISIRWQPPLYNGGLKILGYLVEHRRTGSPHWVRATPVLVRGTTLTLSGLEPGMRYQFRVTAETEAGRSPPGPLSEALAVSFQRDVSLAPGFLKPLRDTLAIENEKVELKVVVEGSPRPKVSWFKDGVELFSNRRQRVLLEGEQSSLIIHQAALSDEGEYRCRATNRAGHVSTRALLTLQAGAGLRLPRQYEEGLLFELGEAVRLRVGVTGKPEPTVTWYHDGREVGADGRVHLARSERHACLSIAEAARCDRGEYRLTAANSLGSDSASILVTITDRPLAPGKAHVVMTMGRCITLSWTAPGDDGGCKIGNYIVEYYRVGWNMWLKGATCRQLSTTLGDLIQGSQYKFRVKAENPYGLSDPSSESDLVFIPDPNRGLLEPPRDGEADQREVEEDREEGRRKHRELEPETSWEDASPLSLANQVLRKVKLAPRRGWSEDSQQSPPGTPERQQPVAPRRRNRDRKRAQAIVEEGGNKEEEKYSETWSEGKLEEAVEEQQEPNQDRELRRYLNQEDRELRRYLNQEDRELRTYLNQEDRELRSYLNQEDKELRRYSNQDENLQSSSEMMIVLLPDGTARLTSEKEEKQKKEEEYKEEDEEDRETDEREEGGMLPMSLSSPELSSCEPVDVSSLRCWVSSTELLHERTLARMNRDMEEERAEQALKIRYALERKRSFERRAPRADLPPCQPPTDYPVLRKSSKDKFLQSDSSFEEFSTRIDREEEEQQSDYDDEDGYDDDDYDESSDIEMKYDFEKSRISRYIKETVEEETYHPRNMVSALPRSPVSVGNSLKESSPNLQERSIPIITLNEELLQSSPPAVRKDNFERPKSRSPDKDLKLVICPVGNMDNPSPPSPNSVVPKPILKVRDPPLKKHHEKKFASNLISKISLRKSPVREAPKSPVTERDASGKNKKKVRIEEPDDFLVEGEGLVKTGVVAKNRRLGATRPRRDQNDPADVVISHYSDIVREFGGGQRAKPVVYLNYEELKAAAERSEQPAAQTETPQPAQRLPPQQQQPQPAKPTPKLIDITRRSPVQGYSQFFLDLFLFFIASYIYMAKDPRLAIPVIFLMAYRHLHENIAKWIPYKKKPLGNKQD